MDNSIPKGPYTKQLCITTQSYDGGDGGGGTDRDDGGNWGDGDDGDDGVTGVTRSGGREGEGEEILAGGRTVQSKVVQEGLADQKMRN